jgi:hypothetical protein
MNSTALTMIAVIMTAAFMVTAFVWQQPQQTQALRGSESSSPSCVENQLCDTSITKSSTPSSKLTSSPYSASSSKLVPSPASIFAPQSLLPDPSSSHPSSSHPSSSHPSSSHPSSSHPSSSHPSSPSSKLTQSPASSLTLTPPPSSKLKHHNFHSSTSITSHDTSSVNSTGSLSNDLSHLFD